MYPSQCTSAKTAVVWSPVRYRESAGSPEALGGRCHALTAPVAAMHIWESAVITAVQPDVATLKRKAVEYCIDGYRSLRSKQLTMCDGTFVMAS